MEDLWTDSPDVVWTCVVYEGTAVLAIQSDEEPTCTDWLSRDLKRIDVRFLFDQDKLPEYVPIKFICFEGEDMMNPILATSPAAILRPLSSAMIAKRPWWLALQMVIDGLPFMKLLVVHPDGTTEPARDPLGRYETGTLWPNWFVGIV